MKSVAIAGGEMMDINDMKIKIGDLYKRNEEIHVDVHSKKPKINVINAPARIVGVYKNLFMLEAVENGMKKSYTVQYTDLFIGKVKIKELE